MDVLILLLLTICGFAKANAYVIIAGAMALTLLSAKRKIEIAWKRPEVGPGRVLASALFLSLANNTVFTLLSYALGLGVSLLV